MRRWIPVMWLVLATGCNLLPSEEPGPCEDLTGGALVTLDVGGEEVTLWIEDDAFIDEAVRVAGHGPQAARIPLFGEVVPGTTCDGTWEWHVDPGDATWVDTTMELCDAQPSYVEAFLTDWIIEVGSWCPWEVSVVDVIDQR